MAAVAGLGRLVEDVVHFRCIGGVADPALLVKDAHLDHAGLVGHGLNGVVEAFAIVAQHVVGGAALDHIADPLGAGQRGCFQMLAVQSDIQISEQSEDDDHHRQQRPDQFRTDAVRQPLLPQSRGELSQSPAWLNTAVASQRSRLWIGEGRSAAMFFLGKDRQILHRHAEQGEAHRDDHESDGEFRPFRNVVMPDVSLKADESDIEPVGDETKQRKDGGQI